MTQETERALLRQCWRSGHISPRQWEQHCREDPELDPVKEEIEMNDNEDNIGLWILGGFIGLALILAIITLTGAWGAIWGRELGKFNEESRRQIQEESRAYQEGMAQNLDRLCLEWERTSNPAIAQSIRHRVAGYNGELPQHIQDCVNLAQRSN